MNETQTEAQRDTTGKPQMRDAVLARGAPFKQSLFDCLPQQGPKTSGDHDHA